MDAHADMQTDAPTGFDEIRVKIDPLIREPYLYGFFQTVTLLEKMLGEDGSRSKGPLTNRIRIRPHPGLGFPAADIREVRLVRGDVTRAEVIVTFFGLYGVHSPLPVYFYDTIAAETEDSIPLRDFLDIFNCRIYSLYYGAWKKYRPSLHYREDGMDAFSRRIISLAGLRTDRNPTASPLPTMRLAACAGLVSRRVKNAEGLKNLVELFLDGIEVQIRQNVPRWVGLQNRPQLGRNKLSGAALGSTATIGKAVRDVSGRFRVILGPLDLLQYHSLLPGGVLAKTVEFLVRLYAPDMLEYDVQLCLKREEIPPVQLGAESGKLGQGTWLGKVKPPTADRIVQYAH